MEFRRLKYLDIIDYCFFVNAILSTLPITLVIFFLLNHTVTEEDLSVLFSLKFWSVALFSFAFLPLSKKFDIKTLILFSFILKIIGYAIFFLYQNFYGAIWLVLINGFSAAIFSTAAKIYLQHTAENISLSLSKRFTINNISVAITPLFILWLTDLTTFVVVIAILSAISIALSLRLTAIPNIQKEEEKEKTRWNFSLISIISLACLLFSIFYLIYEQKIPIYLKNIDDKPFYSVIVMLNTLLITFLQIPVYAWVSKKISEAKALFFAFVLCLGLYLPLDLLGENRFNIILFVLGLTYLEMFFSTGIDSLIIKLSNNQSKYYFTYFNVFIAVCITLASFFIIYSNAILTIAFILLAAIWLTIKKQ